MSKALCVALTALNIALFVAVVELRNRVDHLESISVTQGEFASATNAHTLRMLDTLDKHDRMLVSLADQVTP